MFVSYHVSKSKESTVHPETSKLMNENNKANIIVKHVPNTVTEEQLKKKFERFGPIISMKINEPHYESNYNFAYIMYKEVSDAQKAI